MSDNEHDDQEGKRSITVNFFDKKIIDLKIRLAYENIPMPTFFRIVVDAFLDNDDRILSLIIDWREKANKKRVNRHIKSMIARRKKTEKNFSITKEDMEKIYDKFISKTEFDTLLEELEEEIE